MYDLSGFKLLPGDHLRIKVKPGVLEAEIIHSEQIDLAKIAEWCTLMEKSLYGVLKEFGPLTDIYTQIEQAYFCQKLLLKLH